jgi:DNA-binding MarR family transcriptional regulator
VPESHGSYIYVIKQLDLALRPRFAQACATEGLTLAQYTALTVLKRLPGTTSSELARRSFVRPQTMATTLDPLLESGFVRREADPEHGRKMRVFLTDQGDAVVARLAPRIEAIEELLVSDLDEDERTRFADYLRRSRHAMHEVKTRPREQR